MQRGAEAACFLWDLRETTKASDDEIGRNLVGLARSRPDVFGACMRPAPLRMLLCAAAVTVPAALPTAFSIQAVKCDLRTALLLL